MERVIFRPLTMRPLRGGAVCRPPARRPAPPVTADSPALETMTDLRAVPPATIGRRASLHEANEAMRAWGVRLLFVVDADFGVEGLITARDTIGEKPVNWLRERGGRYDDLTVADLMVPRDKIEVLELDALRHADVGHVVATLQEIGRQHAVVVDRDRKTGEETICGVYSVTQIARQLGMSIPVFDVAHTFADIAAHFASR
jgi:hypothetical protein